MMNFQEKKKSFVKVCLISFLVATMMGLVLSARVMANPVQIKVVDSSDNSIIEANPGDAVDIYIRLDNVEEYIDPNNPTIQAIQFMFTDVDSVLNIDYTTQDGQNIPAVVAFGVTEGSDVLEGWPVYSSFVDNIVSNPINIDLAMNPVDPSFFNKDWYDGEPPDLPELPWPANADGIYYLPESGKILKISAHVKSDAPAGDHPLVLSELPDGKGGTLAIINEKEKEIISSQTEDGTLRVGAPAGPVASDIMVTDVHPTGFSVVWISDQPSTCTLKVFDDENGTQETVGAIITSESAENPPAEDNGVMKVRVSGLSANTTYYFQTSTTSKSTGGTTFEPAEPPFLSVTTEIESVPVSNDILLMKIYQEDGITPAAGALFIVSVDGASSPLTGWVGAFNPALPEYAPVDLSNIFDADTHKTLDLVGGEPLTVDANGGGGSGLGCVTPRNTEIPTEISGPQVIFPDDPFIFGPCITDVPVTFEEGLNVLNIPIQVPPEIDTAYELLEFIGTIDEVSKLQRVTDGGVFETVVWFELPPLPPMPSGPNFPIKNFEGYIVYMKGTKEVTFSGQPVTSPSPIDLVQGLNLIGLPHLGESTIKAYDLLEAIGTIDEVAKLQRVINGGVFETVVWFELPPLPPMPSGPNFDVIGTAGYLVYMKVNKPGWTPPVATSTLTAQRLIIPNRNTSAAPSILSSTGLSVPSVSNITVTDVNVTTFSVVWGASEASTCTLNVFDDIDGTTPTAGAVIEAQSAEEAQNRGIMKVKVTGLSANTTYFFQTVTTSKSTGDTTEYPQPGSLLPVTTEIEAIPVSNDKLFAQILEADGTTPVSADGALLIVTVEGASSPLSGWAGNINPQLPSYAEVDPSNIFSASTHKSWDLQGGENADVWAFGGISGSKHYTVTIEESGSSQLLGDLPLPVGLSSFTAVVKDNRVILKWTTTNELSNLGFDVYRGESPNGKFIKVNPAYIKGAGTDANPHNYKFVDESAVVGKTYYYYIESISFSGVRERSHIIKVIIDASGKVKVTGLMQPTTFVLLQNFPNPFNPETWIPFRLAKNVDVTIRIFDIKGQEVRTIHLGQTPAGYYDTRGKAVRWDGRDNYGQEVSSGIYFYNLTAGTFSAMRKLIIVK